MKTEECPICHEPLDLHTVQVRKNKWVIHSSCFTEYLKVYWSEICPRLQGLAH